VRLQCTAQRVEVVCAQAGTRSSAEVEEVMQKRWRGVYSKRGRRGARRRQQLAAAAYRRPCVVRINNITRELTPVSVVAA